MKSINMKSFISIVLIFVIALGVAQPTSAQVGNFKTNTRIMYHGGPVMLGVPRIYIIFYGNWTGNNAPAILDEFASAVSSPPYLQINSGYPDSNGNRPTGGVLYVGAVGEPTYSRGPTLAPQDIHAIIADKIDSGLFPLDTTAIYLVIAPSDVTDLRPDGSTFCTPGNPPLHGVGPYMGTYFKYGFIGSWDRCPSSAGLEPVLGTGGSVITPNGNFAADAMANTMARLLNVMITNPFGKDYPALGSWYDRFGLENADKCVGKFGTIYTTANGARANFRAAGKDYIVQQNWVNDRKGYCSHVP